MVVAGKLHPRTPLECKFSLPFCIALGLRGYRLVASNFTAAAMGDTAVTLLLPVIEIEVVADQPQYEAHLAVSVEGGASLRADTEIVLGHAQNPMSPDDFKSKFQGLVEPVLGSRKSGELHELLTRFEQSGNLRQVTALLAADARSGN